MSKQTSIVKHNWRRHGLEDMNAHARVSEELRHCIIDRHIRSVQRLSNSILNLFARMAVSWYLGARIRKRLFLSEGLLEAVLICVAICVSLAPSASHAQTGFLSIDCGYTGASYNDSHGLTWVADEGTFITTGKTAIQSYYANSDLADSLQSTQSFRYFPEPRSKYCYNLTTDLDADVPYLIRASFYLNGSVFNKSRPFQFNVFINANNWFTITSGEDSPSEFLVIEEAIFYARYYNLTFICIQPMVGVPFISSLELRPLETNMYSYSNYLLQYLVLLRRWNLGAKSTPSVRFPDDNFDRIWYTLPATCADNLPIISTATPPDNTTTADIYYVPPKVMKDGWLMSGPATNFTDPAYLTLGLSSSPFSYTGDQVYMTPGEYAFAVLYSEYLDVSDLQTYSVDVNMDNSDVGNVSFSHNASMQANPNFVLSSNSLGIAFTDLNLTKGPTLNAVEVYGQVSFNFSETDPSDVVAIEVLKTSLSLTDWQGDPCTPVPHDWLSCGQTPWTSGIQVIQPIQQPCGSNVTSVKECQVQQGSYFLNAKYSVTALNISKLGNLSLFTSASANSTGIFLPSLTEMRLTNSGVDTDAFIQLINNFLVFLAQFTILDLSNNNINSVPVASYWTNVDWGPSYSVQNLTTLNLSRNALTDTLGSFENVPFVLTLQELDLSYNLMRTLPTTWINTTNSLVRLDLSHNLLQEDIQLLDEFIGINNVSLQTLNVSYNQLTGPLNSSLYFSSLPNLTIANFDHNSIQGTLNLTAWYNALQAIASKNLSTLVDTLPLFSFVNNSIADIFPSADKFESIMTTLTKNQTFLQKGILLGGNPYCNSAKSYTQRYLCRSSVDEYVPEDHHSNKNILIIGISSGVGAFILLLAILATLWKLWKQVYELREIQRALANRKVQPPFYQYSDLKFSTREFHKDYKLGHGGFGVVYKGVLADKTTLAVKKLFNSQRLQELDEFLNEVVLLTGIKHKNLVQLKGCCIKDKQRMLVYEFAEKGNLAEALWGSKVHGGLNWEQRFNICVGIARGLSYLHEELQPSIIHRDIKPENVLLDRNFKPKIADFGLARQFEEPNQARYTQVAGTLGYFSPEYASEGQLSSKADVYSYGIVVLEIVTGRKCIDSSLPYEAKFLKDWVRRMHKKGLTLDILQPELRDDCDEAQVMRVINIGLLCVQHDPERRPSMSTVVTMLLGSADVEVFLDESDNAHSDFKTLMLSINHELENPALENPTLLSIVEEDSDNFHLIDLSSESSSSNPSGSRKSSKPLIELSTIQGR